MVTFIYEKHVEPRRLFDGEVSKIRQENHELLQPGMKVRIAQKLIGNELYDCEDPEEMKSWYGKEVTVKYVKKYTHWMVGIEEAEFEFFMEEIECIIDEAEITESEEPIGVLLG